MDRCKKDGVKVIRRISGGGTVLQGKGCLNYSIFLKYGTNENYKSIKRSYIDILGKIIDGFQKKNINIEFYPLSDMALDGKKVSGNAQARKRTFFLHHGTFLYDFRY